MLHTCTKYVTIHHLSQLTPEEHLQNCRQITKQHNTIHRATNSVQHVQKAPKTKYSGTSFIHLGMLGRLTSMETSTRK